jgi:hypothetical protein
LATPWSRPRNSKKKRSGSRTNTEFYPLLAKLTERERARYRNKRDPRNNGIPPAVSKNFCMMTSAIPHQSNRRLLYWRTADREMRALPPQESKERALMRSGKFCARLVNRPGDAVAGLLNSIRNWQDYRAIEPLGLTSGPAEDGSIAVDACFYSEGDLARFCEDFGRRYFFLTP